MTSSAPHQAGYITDVPYPDYFHRELMPLWLCSTLQALGRRAPDLRLPYTWLELGCGSGISTVIAAATNPLGRFIGLDINPQAIARAQALADAAGLRNVRFVCQSFDEALNAEGAHALPACDFIVSHGVYSWISPAQRSALRTLVARHLAPGGVLYLAYMSQPGSATMAAAQKLAHLTAHNLTVQNLAVQGTSASAQAKADAAIDLLRTLSAAGTGYFTEHPRLAAEIDTLAAMDRRYIAHEFLNAHWDSLHVADVMEQLHDIGCTYAGSATLLENVDGASLPERCLPVLAQLRAQGASVAAQETFKDIARNQNQRRDLYQRTAVPGSAAGAAADATDATNPARDRFVLPADAHRTTLLAQCVALLPAAPDVRGPLPASFTLETRIGPVHMPMAHVAPLLAALQAGPQSYAQLIAHPLYAQQPGAVSQLLQLLAWVGWVHFVRPDWQGAPSERAEATTLQALNAALAQHPCGQPARRYTAHAAIGSALPQPL